VTHCLGYCTKVQLLNVVWLQMWPLHPTSHVLWVGQCPFPTWDQPHFYELCAQLGAVLWLPDVCCTCLHFLQFSDGFWILTVLTFTSLVTWLRLVMLRAISIWMPCSEVCRRNYSLRNVATVSCWSVYGCALWSVMPSADQPVVSYSSRHSHSQRSSVGGTVNRVHHIDVILP